MKKYFTKLTIVSCFCIALVSCNSNYSVQIVNPTDKDIVVIIDGEELGVVNGGVRVKTLSGGEHTVALEGQDPVTIDINKGPEVVINPTKTRFIKEKIYFTTSEDMMMNTGNDTLNVGGYEVVGDFKDLGSDILIEGKWDYGPNDRVDTEIQVYTTGKDGSATRTKVHSQQDYVKQLESEYRNLIKEYEKEGLDGSLLKALLGLTDEQFEHIMK